MATNAKSICEVSEDKASNFQELINYNPVSQRIQDIADPIKGLAKDGNLLVAVVQKDSGYDRVDIAQLENPFLMNILENYSDFLKVLGAIDQYNTK